jgi:hypothetical protein
MTTSKMGVGDEVGIAIGVGEEAEAGLVVARDGCVAMTGGEASTDGKPCGAHAVQRTRMKRKIRDFIFVLLRSMVE